MSALRLSTQLRIAAETAGPEIGGIAHMILTKWAPEATILEKRVEALEKDLAEAMSLLENATADISPDLRRSWTKRRSKLRQKVKR